MDGFHIAWLGLDAALTVALNGYTAEDRESRKYLISGNKRRHWQACSNFEAYYRNKVELVHAPGQLPIYAQGYLTRISLPKEAGSNLY